jgi:hypothetical protein
MNELQFNEHAERKFRVRSKKNTMTSSSAPCSQEARDQKLKIYRKRSDRYEAIAYACREKTPSRIGNKAEPRPL